MPSKSKDKGNRLERDIRDLLNNAYTTDQFARTPNSGAIMGLSNWEKNQKLEDSTKRALGSDIICPSWFRFSIECKNYKDKPNFAKLLWECDSDIDGWIGEVLFDAVNMKRTPLLFFRTTRQGTFCVLPIKFIHVTNVHRENFLRYREEFMIVRSDFFFVNGALMQKENEAKYDDIQLWLKESSTVQYLITNMLSKKGKKK